MIMPYNINVSKFILSALYNSGPILSSGIIDLPIDAPNADAPTFRHDIPNDITITFIIEDINEDFFEKLKDPYEENHRRYRKPYVQPHYINRLHPCHVIAQRKCRIRNRPNSGHGFYNN